MRQETLEALKRHEGCFPHMYLDTKGLVTVGVGQLLSSVEEAKKLPFINRTTQKPATPTEIDTDYSAVKKQPVDHIADFYKQFTQLDLPQSDIDALFKARV